MRNPLQVLQILESRAKDETYRFDKLIKHFYNIEFYEAAYAKIYSKEGNMTEGTDSKTIDGFSLKHVETLIEAIKNESYEPEPVRRVEIPKKNDPKKKRPLGIPAFYDKLVQQVMVFILEVIYEPVFEDTSHGYRPNRSCHTALYQVKQQFTGTKWWIEGDIKGFFDNINHNKMIELLRKRIMDEKFLRLVRKFLKAGYVYERQLHKTYAGTPQGGIVSPILANIYLNELDKKVKQISLEYNTTKRQRRANNEYKLIADKIYARRKKLKMLTLEEKEALEEKLEKLLQERNEYRLTHLQGQIAEKDRHYKYLSKIIYKVRRELKELTPEEREKETKEIRELQLKMRKLPAMDEFDENYRRLKYVRYADDFLISIIGTKEDAKMIKERLGEFLKEELSLDLSEEKTLITHNSKKVRFLGYDIFVGTRHEGKVALTKNSGRMVKKRVDSKNIKLSLPHDKIKDFLVDKRMIKITNDGRWKAIHRPYLLVNSPLEILRQYNSEFGGLYQYYKLAFDVKEKLGSVHQLFSQSFAKTLAGKHKTKVSKLRNKYMEYNGTKVKAYVNDNGNWGVHFIKNGKDDKEYIAFAELFPYRDIIVVKELENVDSNINVINEKHIVTNYARTEIVQRMRANKCEWCGDDKGPFEVHHIRKLKNIKNKKNKKFWELMHIYRNRKTLVLCADGSKNNCHRKLHSGKLDQHKKMQASESKNNDLAF